MAFLTTKKIFAVILLFCVSAFSQEISFDLLNAQKTKKESGAKPDWAASGLNLIVPGTGYFYLGEKKSASAFLTADIILWGAFFYANFTSLRRYDSSIGYAKVYAHTQSRRPYDDAYWSYLGNKNFMRTQDLNWALQNNREFDMIYINESDFWSWDSEDNRDEYAKMRTNAGYWKTASTLILGSLALNRLVSFVTVRVATKRYNEKIFSAPLITPTADLETKTLGVSFLLGF